MGSTKRKLKDHQPKKPTAAQLAAALKQAQDEEAKKTKEFTAEYNALCRKYGMVIQPQMTIKAVPFVQ